MTAEVKKWFSHLIKCVMTAGGKDFPSPALRAKAPATSTAGLFARGLAAPRNSVLDWGYTRGSPKPLWM